MNRLLVVISMTATAMIAAEPADWKALQELRPGDKVGVIQMNQKRLEGRFERVSDNEITIDAQTVAKTDVVRVYRRAGMNRITRIAIGAGIGVAAGAVITQTAGRRFENEGAKFGGINDAGWYAVSIGAGAGLGALSGSDYQTLYRRP